MKTAKETITELATQDIFREKFADIVKESRARLQTLLGNGSPETLSANSLFFDKWRIDPREVFLMSKNSFAFVNTRPILPGHVLVSPIRVVPKFRELTKEETIDLSLMVQAVSSFMEDLHKSNSSNISMQDGPTSGQSVPHVHFHVIPRFPNDFENPDDIFNKIAENDVSRPSGVEAKNTGRIKDENRIDRTPEEMYREAKEIRDFIYDNIVSEREKEAGKTL